MLLDIAAKIDFAFKKLFGPIENKPILIDLLNAILEEPMTECEILNPFNLQETDDDKLFVVDIKAHGSGNWLLHIEMQMDVTLLYVNRALYYWSRLYSQQLLMVRTTLNPIRRVPFIFSLESCTVRLQKVI